MKHQSDPIRPARMAMQKHVWSPSHPLPLPTPSPHHPMQDVRDGLQRRGSRGGSSRGAVNFIGRARWQPWCAPGCRRAQCRIVQSPTHNCPWKVVEWIWQVYWKILFWNEKCHFLGGLLKLLLRVYNPQKNVFFNTNLRGGSSLWEPQPKLLTCDENFFFTNQ